MISIFSFVSVAGFVKVLRYDFLKVISTFLWKTQPRMCHSIASTGAPAPRSLGRFTLRHPSACASISRAGHHPHTAFLYTTLCWSCWFLGFFCCLYVFVTFWYLSSCLLAPLLLDLVSGDWCSLLADSVWILAMLSPIQPPSCGCCCYQTGALVGLMCILRVMPLSGSFEIRVGLKDLETIMPLPVPPVLVFSSLYTAPVERTMSFFDLFTTVCMYLLHCYFRFWSVVGESTHFFRSFTLFSFWINSGKEHPL